MDGELDFVAANHHAPGGGFRSWLGWALRYVADAMDGGMSWRVAIQSTIPLSDADQESAARAGFDRYAEVLHRLAEAKIREAFD